MVDEANVVTLKISHMSLKMYL